MKYKIKITDESEKKEINIGEDEIIEIKYNIGLAENTDFANNRSSIEMMVTGKVISNIENNTDAENNEKFISTVRSKGEILLGKSFWCNKCRKNFKIGRGFGFLKIYEGDWE